MYKNKKKYVRGKYYDTYSGRGGGGLVARSGGGGGSSRSSGRGRCLGGSSSLGGGRGGGQRPRCEGLRDHARETACFGATN